MRLTRSGFSVLATGVAVYLLGVALGYAAVAMLGSLFLLMVVAALPWLLGRVRIDAQRSLQPQQVERGRVALAELRAQPRGRFGVRSTEVVDVVAGEVVRVQLPRLRRNASHRSTYRLPTEQRGVIAVGPLIIERSDPLQLVRRETTAAKAVELTVFPRVHALQAPRSGSVLDVDEGHASEHALEGAGSFQGLRPYLPGDDIRKIHWRTTARTGQLMVRKYVEAEQPDTVVVLDDAADAYASHLDAEEAVDVAASIMAADVRSPTLHLLGSRVSATKADALQTLTVVALDQTVEGTTLEGAVELGDRRAGTTVVITGANRYADGRDLISLASLARRVVIIVIAPGTSESSRAGGTVLLKGDSARTIAALWNGLT